MPAESARFILAGPRNEAASGLFIFDKGKPVARRGRKAMGPSWSFRTAAGCQVAEKMRFPRYHGTLIHVCVRTGPVRFGLSEQEDPCVLEPISACQNACPTLGQ